MRILLAALLLTSATAQAHIAMRFPVPRTSELKTGPCGAVGSTRGTNVMTFQPGETITVEWDETADHPGHYRIAFDDSGDDGFVDPNNPNDDFPTTLVDQIADKAGGHYTQQVRLPTTPCADCTLQLMQVMTTAIPYNSFYYQCADVVLAGDPIADVDGGCSTGPGAGTGMVFVMALAIGRRRRTRPHRCAPARRPA
jgi:uncharacterized protein (TIGR03382 family)